MKTVKSLNRLLLTGTPLQNNLAELWSLLNFLLPEIFDDLAVFESWFDAREFGQQEGAEKILKQEKEKRVLTSLREILKPFMLRRVKSEVCLEVPPKKELVVYAPLTELQHSLYQAVLNRDIQTLCKIKEPEVIVPLVDGQRPKRRCVLESKYGSSSKDFENSSESKWSLNSSLTNTSNTYDENKWTVKNTTDQKDDLSVWRQYTDVTERNREFLVSIQFRNTSKCSYIVIRSCTYVIRS